MTHHEIVDQLVADFVEASQDYNRFREYIKTDVREIIAKVSYFEGKKTIIDLQLILKVFNDGYMWDRINVYEHMLINVYAPKKDYVNNIDVNWDINIVDANWDIVVACCNDVIL